MITDPDPKYIVDLLGIELREIYSIPKYQRDFSWESKHWTRLYEDIENDHDHFLGAIICVEREVKDRIHYYEIVDGQQRITTMALFICAVYKRMMELEITNHFSTEKELEAFRDDRKNIGKRIVKNDVLKLRLSFINSNKDDFNNILKEVNLLDQPVRDFEYRTRSLYKTFNFFYEQVKNKENFQDFIKLIENLSNAYVIQIKANTDSSAYSIFESLNNTGLALGPLDLIKNKFFRELEKYNADLLQNDPTHFDDLTLTDENALHYWDNIFRNIEKRQDRIDFLKHYSALYFTKEEMEANNVTLKSKNANEKLIETFEKFVEVKKINFLKELSKKSEFYSLFVDPKNKPNILEIKNELILLDYISAVPSRTFLLYIFSRYENDRLLQKGILKVLIKYFVRHHVTQYPDNRKLSKIFLDLAKECEEHGPINPEFVETYLNTIDRCKNKTTFEDGLKKLKYSSGNADLIRSLFWIIEDPYRNRENPKDFFAKTETNEGEEPEYIWTLEHILPQKMKANWIATLHLTPNQNPNDIHELWIHSLGNLTLTGYNRTLSNKPFLNKLNCNSETGVPIGLKNGIHLNEEFEELTEDSWTPIDIENRRDRLVREISEKLKFFNE